MSSNSYMNERIKKMSNLSINQLLTNLKMGSLNFGINTILRTTARDLLLRKLILRINLHYARALKVLLAGRKSVNVKRPTRLFDILLAKKARTFERDAMMVNLSRPRRKCQTHHPARRPQILISFQAVKKYNTIVDAYVTCYREKW